jgi:creatinine amidohydrolase
MAKFAVLPFGAFEYHGPVGSPGIDTYPPEFLANKLAEALGGVAFPAIEYSALPLATRSKPGSISVRHETMVAFVEDVLNGIYGTGIPGAVVINGHFTNVGIVEAAGQRACEIYRDRFLLLINCWDILSQDVLRKLFPRDLGDGHGGAWELSVTQALMPGAVDLSKGTDQELRYSAGRGSKVYSEGMRSHQWVGYEGAITASSADKGRQILDESFASLVKTVAALLQHVQR